MFLAMVRCVSGIGGEEGDDVVGRASRIPEDCLIGELSRGDTLGLFLLDGEIAFSHLEGRASNLKLVGSP